MTKDNQSVLCERTIAYRKTNTGNYVVIIRDYENAVHVSSMGVAETDTLEQAKTVGRAIARMHGTITGMEG